MATLSKLGPGLLTFGEEASAKEFGTHVSEVSIEPEYDQDDDIYVLSGDTYAGDETEKWTLKFVKYQDYTSGTLDQWLYDNSGTELPFTFVPDKGGVLQVKGTVTIRAGKIGGEVRKRNNTELELACIGKPVVTSDYASDAV